MSITTSFRIALTAAALCAAASTADARPRRLVILDFDGPRQLADVGRSSVMSLLGEQYDVVSTKRWEDARSAAAQRAHGPEQWSKAAKQSGVGAVIEGVVQDEGRRKILNITVRQADNGKEFDTISVRLDPRTGLSTENARQLQQSLDEILEWIDSGPNEIAPVYAPVTVKRIGSSKPAGDADADPAARRRGKRAPVIDAEEVAASDEPADPKPVRKRRPAAELDAAGEAPARPAKAETRSDAASEGKTSGKSDARADRSDDGETTADSTPAHDARPSSVSVADPELHDLEILFPQRSDEREKLDPLVHHVPRRTSRVMVDAGGYIGSRSLTWDADPDSTVQQFPGVSSKGFELNAAFYPFPTQQMDGVLSGVGFTASFHHSVGSTVVSDEGDAINEYVINQNGWEIGAHYRLPINSLVAIDGGAFYGNQTYEIVDASMDFETPDTKYSYLGLGAHLDLAITDRALVGFGARYFTVLDEGMLASTDFFGPVSASGLGLEATFKIPLPASLYVRGQLSYQRISLETSGGGVITDDENVTGGTDSLIVGNVNLGIEF